MNTKLTAHQFDLNENLHNYVNEKLTASIAPLIDDPASQLEVTLGLQAHNHAEEHGTCTVNLVMPRVPPIVVQKSGATVYAAIDAVHDTLFDQVSNILDRRHDRHHRRLDSAHHRDEVARQVLTANTDGPIAPAEAVVSSPESN